MDFEAMINQLQEMKKELEEFGEEHAVLAARRIGSVIVSVKKAASLELDADDEANEEA